MSLPALVSYLFGMVAILAGEQVFSATTGVRAVLDVGGGAALAAAALLRWRSLRDTDDAGIELGRRIAFALTLVGAGSLVMYVLSLDAVARGLGFAGTALTRWTGVWGAVWPVVWLCGTLPLLLVEYALQRSPVVAPTRLMRESLHYGLSAALGIALVFPVNYLASRHVTEWNLSYFKTAQAGSSTRALVESLQNPVHVYAFFPSTSRVGSEIERYFAGLEGSKLVFHRLDQTAHPRIARALEVRGNGTVAFTNREVDRERAPTGPSDEEEGDGDRVVKTFDIDTDLEEARSKLEKLDRHVKKRLTTVSRGKSVAYLTTGHGEFSTDRGTERRRRLRMFERLLQAAGFEVKTLGMSEGLANGVPEDADMVAVIGPSSGFLDNEVEALGNYFDGGGSVLVALEPDYSRSQRATLPGDDPLRGFLDRFGLSVGDGVLASRHSSYTINRNKTDRLYVITNRFSSHPSTATISGTRLAMMFPTAGYLETSEGAAVEPKVTVRSRADTWVDRNGNLGFDKQAGEQKQSWPIVAAAGGSNNPETEGRVLISADATAFSDLGLRPKANQQFAYDTAHWLVGMPDISGSVTNEEDVRIRHTQEGQALWFYGTALGVPLLLFAAGAFRVWRRREGGET